MTLMCIDRSQSPTHKASFPQGGKAGQPRRSSCSPPLPRRSPEAGGAPGRGKPDHPPDRRNSTGNSAAPQQQQQQGGSNSSRYKTELCRPFEESGACKYGDKCQFAHGARELRSMARHPKYKTELCRTFHSTGLCPYGPRCHFIHNSDQARKSLLTSLAQPPRPSLGSAGDASPPSSHGGTPTAPKSFDDLYQTTPLSPALSTGSGGTAFQFPQDLAALVSSLNQRFAELPPAEVGGGAFAGDFPGGPVLELFGPAAPLTPPTPAEVGAGFFPLPLFDLFHRPQKHQQHAM